MRATFDPAPVLADFDGQTNRTVANALGVSTRTVAAWRNGHRRLTLPHADELAVRIGSHPGELWPEWWADV